MRPIECAREQDVLDALASRRWPARADPELRAHVAGCSVCADLVEVASALLDAGDDPAGDRELPPASLVWWRAQLRAREEAARAALRPIRTVQAAALACGALLAIVALVIAFPLVTGSFEVALANAATVIARVDPHAATDAALGQLANRGVQIAAGAWLILAPVAAYLAFTRE